MLIHPSLSINSTIFHNYVRWDRLSGNFSQLNIFYDRVKLFNYYICTLINYLVLIILSIGHLIFCEYFLHFVGTKVPESSYTILLLYTKSNKVYESTMSKSESIILLINFVFFVCVCVVSRPSVTQWLIVFEMEGITGFEVFQEFFTSCRSKVHLPPHEVATLVREHSKTCKIYW